MTRQDGLFIGVDWGTSSMRAMLCSPDQSALAFDTVVTGPGIAKLTRSVPEVLMEAIEPWRNTYGPLKIVLAGMAGSNIGWREAPYLECPADLSDLSKHAVSFTHKEHPIEILPGLKGQNALGQPDLMRGEELQICGWMARNSAASQTDRLLCLPGTHTKWARLDGGQVTSFSTALTGELYGILNAHSILIPKSDGSGTPAFDSESFRIGVEVIRTSPSSLLHLLFSTRTLQLTAPGQIKDPASYLSGLLIGSDVATAIANCAKPNVIVECIGAPALCQKYAEAARQLGHDCRITDGNVAVHAGFLSLRNGDSLC